MNPPSVPLNRSHDAAPLIAERLRREATGAGALSARSDVHALHRGTATSNVAATRDLIAQLSRLRRADEATLAPPPSSPPDPAAAGSEAVTTASTGPDSSDAPPLSAPGLLLASGSAAPNWAFSLYGPRTKATARTEASALREVSATDPGERTTERTNPKEAADADAQGPVRSEMPTDADSGLHSMDRRITEAMRPQPDDLANMKLLETVYSIYLGREVTLRPDVDAIRTRHPNLDPHRTSTAAAHDSTSSFTFMATVDVHADQGSIASSPAGRTTAAEPDDAAKRHVPDARRAPTATEVAEERTDGRTEAAAEDASPHAKKTDAPDHPHLDMIA